MARRKAASSRNRKKAPGVARPRKTTARRPTAPRDRALVPVRGADRREVGGVRLEIGPAVAGRVKRMVYPAGFRWSTHMKPIVRPELCMMARVGVLAQVQIHV